jgi:preprotein translocase subunit SecA
MFLLKKLFGDENKKALKVLNPIVLKINSFESSISTLSDTALKDKTIEFKERLSKGETLDELLPEAYAVVRESAKRNLSQRHFDVQLIGGMILHQGNIAEMRTGEGKTLVATLPVYLNALSGKGVHVITVNDYLSKRDAVWMGQIYNFLGLSVGIINHESSFIYDPEHKELDKERDETGSFKVVNEFLRPVTRKDAYATDITYGTNNEFGFDYLRDNIEYQKENLRQRGHNFAIVDEIDSILIDEARTPLIISAPAAESGGLYAQFSKIANQMNKDEDFTVDEKLRAASLTDEGIEKAEKILGVDNIYTEKGIKFVHHLETAVRAKALFEKDKDYVVKDGEIVIVDEFTGRLQPGRRWSEGLHQAIEAKEGVEVQKESRTFASITFQNYFRMYDKLSGMTGTALTSEEEFYSVYGLHTVAVPTNVDTKRIDNSDLIFQTEKGKFKAIARTVKELNEKGQPMLIGTASIEKNELLSAYLTREGISHEILNAKKHEQEGEVIAQAGIKGRVTIATNMAGRGVDIKLGGNPGSPEKYEEVKKLGGLFVLGTERHEARRIDNQLRGRSGRQGDEGETQFFVSLEDSLMRVFASDMIKRMMGRFGIAEDEPIQNSLITRSLESAQSKIEGFNFDARKHILEYDDIMNQQRSAIYSRRRKIMLGDKDEIRKELEELIQGDEEMKKIVVSKTEQFGEEQFFNAFRKLTLQVIDMLWVEHLEVMDYTRGSVNLRAYGQRDPLIEYKKEGLKLFKDMEMSIDDNILKLLPNIGGNAFAQERQKVKEVHEEDKEKIGRNDPCYCGSGKKFKKCHRK